MLQNDPVIAKIKNNLIKKVISELGKELKKIKRVIINFGKILAQ